MKRFVEGEDRRQATLLPDTLEDYVAQDNPVRVIGVFIDELDLGALGFSGVLACVPRTLTSGNAKRGLFTGQDFLASSPGRTSYMTPRMTATPARRANT